MMEKYIEALCRDIPEGLVFWELSVFLVVSIMIVVVNRFKNGFWLSKAVGRIVVFFCEVEYVFFLIGSTSLLRNIPERFSGCNFRLFWSYSAIRNGNVDLLAENFMNVVVFIPIGLLMGFLYREIRCWHVVLTGIIISSIMETLQYITKRGFTEMDDVIHNTLGCIVGYGVFVMICYTKKYFIRRENV